MADAKKRRGAGREGESPGDTAPLPLAHLRRAAQGRRRQHRAPVGLGASRARPRRPAVHRPARPLRPDPGRGRPRQPGLQDRRDGALGVGDPRRRQRARAARRARSTPSCRPARWRCSPAEIEVLSAAKELPVPVFGEPDYPEDLRLQYRFLDLRRETLHANIMKRLAIIASIRRRMTEAGFFEFADADPDRLEPRGRARLPGALAHPPRQVLRPAAGAAAVQAAAHGLGLRPLLPDRALLPRRGPARRPPARRVLPARRRDELRRAGRRVRAPWSRSSRGVFEEFRAAAKPGDARASRASPTTRRSRKYGTDKPDLRNPIEMQDVTEHFRGSGFKVFAGMIEKDPKARVWAIPAPGGGSRAFCDRMNAWATDEGPAGPRLHLLAMRGAGERRTAAPDPSPRTSGAGARRAADRRSSSASRIGDAVFFAAGNPAKFYKFAGDARTQDRHAS